MNTVICYHQPLHELGYDNKALSDHVSGLSKQGEELLSYWKDSWENNGWKAVVLNEDYAVAHPDYSRLDISNPANILYSNPKPKSVAYQLACYNRLFAYCNYVLNHGSVVYADYDVINYSFSPDDLTSFEDNTVLGCGRSSINLTKIGAKDIVRVIEDQINNYNPAFYNDMILCQKKTRKFVKEKDFCNSTDIVLGYELCKTSKLVHYHGGFRARLSKEKRFNTENTLEFIKRYRPIQ